MITIDNILKIADIQKNQVSIETWHYLNNFFVTYRDAVLREHLINIQDAMEAVDCEEPNFSPSKKTIEEVKELHALCNEHEAGYIRFIEG